MDFFPNVCPKMLFREHQEENKKFYSDTKKSAYVLGDRAPTR